MVERISFLFLTLAYVKSKASIEDRNDQSHHLSFSQLMNT